MYSLFWQEPCLALLGSSAEAPPHPHAHHSKTQGERTPEAGISDPCVSPANPFKWDCSTRAVKSLYGHLTLDLKTFLCCNECGLKPSDSPHRWVRSPVETVTFQSQGPMRRLDGQTCLLLSLMTTVQSPDPTRSRSKLPSDLHVCLCTHTKKGIH